jgi:hypothetical protein
MIWFIGWIALTLYTLWKGIVVTNNYLDRFDARVEVFAALFLASIAVPLLCLVTACGAWGIV